MGSNADLVAGHSGSSDPENFAVWWRWMLRGGDCKRTFSKSRRTRALRLDRGSMYPALHRLEYKGGIRAEWGPPRPKAIGGQK